MARSDLLVSLVKASATGDRRLLRSSVEAIIAEERSKQHNVLAERLVKAMNGLASAASAPTFAQDQSPRGKEFLAEIRPRRQLSDLILPDVVRLVCEQLIEEQQRSDLLRAHGLEPRHSALLIGPPGNGKTSLAEAIAEALALPFFVVRYELMIGSYLGETAARLKRMFDYARTAPSVLFFDEFDTIGKERGDTHETGEIKRVVSSLLMQIDDLPNYTVVIAATNHAELLDRAVWRRFQLRVELPKPSIRELAEFIGRTLSKLGGSMGVEPALVARKLGTVSFSEAEQFCLDVARRQTLSLGKQSISMVVNEQLKVWANRLVAQDELGEDSRRGRASAIKTT
jgi:AAA+ superfamily predicted ATPase